MKCLPLATLAMLAATTGAAGIADEFVQIPANPSFAFAKSLNPHSSDAGEASPIMAALSPLPPSGHQRRVRRVHNGDGPQDAGLLGWQGLSART